MSDLLSESMPQATFGAGCFWCVEAIFDRLDGVASVESGYMGGHLDHPTYDQVCSGQTGHAEVVNVVYDPAGTTYERLLEVFFASHDPTQKNRQGADVGTQYRSVIFYHSEPQREAAEARKAQFVAEGVLVVTEISPATAFYPAEAYHQDYYARNHSAPYCQFVIVPKLKKLGMR